MSPDVPYLPIARILESAAQKRAANAMRLQEHFQQRALARAERVRLQTLFADLNTVGTQEWLAEAPSDLIERLCEIAERQETRARGLPKSILFPLRGKRAVGPHRYSLIDEDDLEIVERYSWQPRWNGSRSSVYATRTTIVSGQNLMLRMHREILGIGPDMTLMPDHVDGRTLNNRLCNLRLVTNRQNVLHRPVANRDEDPNSDLALMASIPAWF